VSSQPKWSWNPPLVEITALAGIALGYPKILVFITCTLAHVRNIQSAKTRTSQSAGVLFVIFPPITANAKSGTKEAGKNFVTGFADPIWCLFKQPAVGLTKHGGLGFFTGLGKAGMGLVVRPGSGKQSKPFYLITLSTYMHFIRRFISLTSSSLLANRSTLF
jgi:hypothetical protein